MSATCPFCSVNILKSAFAESENFLGIYNIAPILPGHSLIIPKKHISNFLSVNDGLMLEFIQLSRLVVKTLTTAFKASSFDWTLQEGVEAGQTIEHMHIHIIPRYTNDIPNPGDWYPLLKKHEPEILDSLSRPKLTNEEMEQIVNKLRKHTLK